MSLAQLNISTAANRGATLTILHPDDRVPLKQADGSPVTITVLGKDSDEFVRAERKARQQTREAMMRRQKYSAADEDRQGDAALAACTTGWSGIPAAWLEPGATDEAAAPFSIENAQKLYGNPGVRWLREQVDEFVGDRANFLRT